LTGVSATGSVGTVAFAWQAGGNQAAGLVGTPSVNVTVALTGVAGSGLVGDDVPVKSLALTGVSGSGAVGSVSIGERLVAITGNQAMGNIGNFGVFYWSLIDDNESANWQNIDNVESAGWTLIPTE
jgi:hypothetical protein